MKYKLIIAVLLAITSIEICKAQSEKIYTQKYGSTGYNIIAVTSLDTLGNLFGAFKFRGLFTLDVPKRQITLLEDLPEMKAYQFATLTRVNGGIFGTARITNVMHFYYHKDSGVVLKREGLELSEQHSAEDGPLLTVSGELSFDIGKTWTSPNILKIRNSSGGYAPKGTALVSKIDSDKPQYIVLQDSGNNLLLTGLDKIPATSVIRRYGKDTLVCMDGTNNREKLWLLPIGDTAIEQIDSLLVENVKTKLRPAFIETLNNGTILYVDKTGWYGILKDREIKSALPIELGRVPSRYVQPMDNVTYWSSIVQDSIVFYQVRLDSAPTLRKFKIHADFGLGKVFLHTIFGPNGFHIPYDGTSQYLYDVSGEKPVVISTESLQRDLNFIIDERRMLYTWIEMSDKIHVVNDLGDALYIGENGVGYYDHLALTYNAGDNNEASSYQRRFHGLWREHGCLPPVVTDSTVIFGGPTVREFSKDGKFLRTLLKSHTTCTSVIDDSILVSGNQGVLRVHRSGGVDSLLYSKPLGAASDTIAYPSGVVRASDGSLILGLFGTERKTEGLGTPRTYRWGGILRSTTNGASWQEPLLNEIEGRYVFPPVRTASNSLIAVCMKMVEDTISGGGQTNNESQYSASNVCIIRSTDNGQTWSVAHRAFYSGPYSVTAGTIVEYRQGQLAAATLGGILISTDDGSTWTVDERLPATVFPSSISVSKENLIVAGSDGVYKISIPTSINELRPNTNQILKPQLFTHEQFRRFVQQLQEQGKTLELIDVSGKCYDVRTVTEGSNLANGFYSLSTGTTSYSCVVVD